MALFIILTEFLSRRKYEEKAFDKGKLSAGIKVIILGLAALGVTAVAWDSYAAPQGDVSVGVPWEGEAGIQETVGEIMKREHARQLIPGPGVHRIIPFRTHPERKHNPQNPDSPESSEWPVSPVPLMIQSSLSSPGPFTSQTVSAINFTGATLADTGAFPPDTMGAAGPAQYIVAVNGRIRSFNKTTGLADGILNVNTDTFFTSVMTPPVSNNFTSDPRIRYDRLSGRWFIIMIDVPGESGALPNRVMIAVSSGGTLTSISNFTFFQFRHDLVSPEGDTGRFADYPTLGIDANALYIGVNVFTPAGAFSNTTGFVVRKSSVLGGGPIVVTAFRTLIATDGPFTPQGIDNFDPAATEGYFIGVSNAFFGRLILRRVSTPGGTPSISSDISITVPSTSFPLTVPHLGNTGGANGQLDGLDDRLFAAHVRNGRLWTAHNIGVNSSGTTTSRTRNGSRWYELTGIVSPGTPSVFQSGTVFDSAASNPLFYWIPSIMVSGQGHAAMGFSTAGTNAYANAGTVGRLVGDTLNTMGTPVLYTNSAFSYNPPGDPGGAGGRRWGDYSYACVDPNDDMTIWTIQEWCNATNSYGVQVVKLLAPPPATPSSASPPMVAAGQASVNVNITGTSSSGSGFFDPGAGFPNRINATVSGGVAVNSVAYTDPTHVTLNLSTVGATAGAKTVTVTNPDGQSAASGAAIITVCGTITIDPSTIPAGSYNAAYSQTFTAGGGTGPYSIGLTGALPAGMGFSGATLSGTPTATGSFPITVTATDSLGCSGSQSYMLSINTADTTTTITSHFPNPSSTVQEVTITYTVISSAGTPTGNVTVSDGAFSCTGTVAAGACSLTFPTVGTRTITAQYSGDANFNVSTSTGVTHTVTSPPSPVRIARTPAVDYQTIQSAYNAALDGDIIQIQVLDFIEDVSLNRDISVTLKGGYDSVYADNPGFTSISGSLTILSGIAPAENTVENIAIH